MSRLELVIPGFVPDSCLSLNGRRRSHWTRVRDAQQEARWRFTCAMACHEPDDYDVLRLPESSRFTRAQVTVEFVYSTRRRRDPDGLAGLAKPLLDALVTHGVVPDDDSEHVELTVRAVVKKGVTETRITVEEVE